MCDHHFHLYGMGQSHTTTLIFPKLFEHNTKLPQLIVPHNRNALHMLLHLRQYLHRNLQ